MADNGTQTRKEENAFLAQALILAGLVSDNFDEAVEIVEEARVEHEEILEAHFEATHASGEESQWETTTYEWLQSFEVIMQIISTYRVAETIENEVAVLKGRWNHGLFTNPHRISGGPNAIQRGWDQVKWFCFAVAIEYGVFPDVCAYGGNVEQEFSDFVVFNIKIALDWDDRIGNDLDYAYDLDGNGIALIPTVSYHEYITKAFLALRCWLDNTKNPREFGVMVGGFFQTTDGRFAAHTWVRIRRHGQSNALRDENMALFEALQNELDDPPQCVRELDTASFMSVFPQEVLISEHGGPYWDGDRYLGYDARLF